MGEVKKASIREFRKLGFLKKTKIGCFFHPLGLALEVEIDEGGTERLGRIWDYRDDPEGVIFGHGMISEEKIDCVEELRESKRKTGEKMFDGDIIQKGES